MTDAGHRLILTSGRPLPAVLDVCEEAGLNFSNMIIISNNGGLIYDHENGKALFETRLSQEDVAYITARAKEAGIHIQGYTQSHIVALEMDEELRFYTRRIHMPIKYVKDISAALPQGSYKLLTIHLTNHEALVRFRDNLSDYCGDRIRMVFSNDRYLEIMPAEAEKGRALKFVTDYLTFPHSHTFAAGDAPNDISMLEAAHTGIAMQNANEEVKAHADLVTSKTNNEDGLLEIIEKYFN